jgi:type II secretion system protein I
VKCRRFRISDSGFRILNLDSISQSKISNSQAKGFTLLEVMVAVVIMATVLVTLIGLKNRSMQDVALAEHITMATLLAKNKMMESLQLLASGKLRAPIEDDGDFPDDENLKEYTWKRAVVRIPLPDSTGSFVTEIRIATFWKEGTREEFVELLSYE